MRNRGHGCRWRASLTLGGRLFRDRLSLQIRVALLPELAGDVSQSVCIVIDVLRATTVISTAFERKCPCVYVAATHETAREFARSKGFLLCGETNGQKVEDFDYGNSPIEFATLDLSDKPIVLSTSNGTKAVKIVSGAQQVFLGAAVNIKSVAESAWEKAIEIDSDIIVVCAGTNAEFTLEDATVAGIYVENLVAQAGAWTMPKLSDSAIAAHWLWEREPNLLRGWMQGNHACHLADIGFGEDLGFCATLNQNKNVPTLVLQTDIEMVEAPVVLIR